jgi:hypothetical protein
MMHKRLKQLLERMLAKRCAAELACKFIAHNMTSKQHATARPFWGDAA